MPISTRLYSNGAFLHNGELDEVTQDTISLTSTKYFSNEFDEVTGTPIIDSSLILWLDAGQTTSYSGSGTTWTDLSGNAKHATLANGPTFDNEKGGKIVFDGTNDYAWISSPSPLSGTQLFTFEIWVNFTSVTGDFGGFNKAAWLFAGGTGQGTGQAEFAILSLNNSSFTPNALTYGRGGGGTTGGLYLDVSSLISNGNWYQIVLVRSTSSSQTVYLNGSSIGTGTVSNSFSDGQTDFGALHNNTQYDGFLNGKISNIKIYNRALSSTEIQTNFNALRRRHGI